MKKLTLCCLTILLTMITPILAQPQPKTVPTPIFQRFSDLWFVNGNVPDRLTHHKTLDDVVVSPDGTKIAFTVFAEMSIKAIEETGGYGGGTLPNKILIADFTTGKTTLISGQPEDAVFPPYVTANMIGISHSKPTWSPDGCCLAWGEVYQHSDNYHLRQVVYDLSTGERRIIYQPEEQYGVPNPVPMEWGDAGLLIHEVSWDNKTLHTLHVYSWIGEHINTIELGDTSVIDSGWIRDGRQSYVGVRYSDKDNWFRFDPVSGDMTQIPYPIEYYSPADPLHSLGIAKTEDGWSVRGYVEGQEHNFIFPHTIHFAISPDGQSVVYSTGNHNFEIFHLGDDLATYLGHFSDTVHVVWGAMERRVRYPDPIVATGFYGCLDMTDQLFEIGDRGRVTAGDPNVLRILPGTSAGRVGLLPGEAEFTVISGPICRNGFTWWRVDADGVIGWTAEGSGVNLWLERIERTS